jgi:hypothetical protein
LFEAVTVLAKATNYEVEDFKSSNKKMIDSFTLQDWKESGYLRYVEIFYPVIVFDGQMYLVEEVQRARDMILKPVDHVGLLHNYISGNYNVELTIDVVHRKAFESFIKTIIEDIQIWKKALDSDLGTRFEKEVIKAGKWYSSKRKTRNRFSTTKAQR